MKRRQFLHKGILGSALTVGALGIGVQSAPALALSKPLSWRLALGVPKTLPIWGPGILRFAELVRSLTQGRLNIRVFGAGELIPALETFDAVRAGRLEMGHSAAYYWQGKLPAAPFFTAIPFGGSALDTLAWLQSGGGQEHWDALMHPYNLTCLACGATPSQMTGWFKRPIEKPEDLRGIKIRIPGFASHIYKAAGASPVLVPGGELFTSLATGVIDAAEWVGPYHDYILGLHRAASYYYGPGWQEQGPLLELMINKSAWESLPADFQVAIRTAASDTTLWMLSEFQTKNSEYLVKIQESGKVKIGRLPPEVLEHLKELSQETLQKLVQQNPLAKQVYDSLSQFLNRQRAVAQLTTTQCLSP